MGFRYEWEPRDERPMVVYTEPFWHDDFERATYEAAVNLNPRRPDEGAFTYIRRISELVTQEREALSKAGMSAAALALLGAGVAAAWAVNGYLLGRARTGAGDQAREAPSPAA